MKPAGGKPRHFMPQNGEPKMARLIYFYRNAPTLKNAQAIRSYDRKHPMTRCMLDSAALADVEAAVNHANREG